jgi:hypothetical protein
MVQAILALLGTLAGIVAVVINRRYDAAVRRQNDIEQARAELAFALAVKKFDDAAFWARRLRELSAIAAPPPREPPK